MKKTADSVVEIAKSFTSRYDALSNQLINDAKIQAYFDSNGKVTPVKVPVKSWRALWDTGATATCISKAIVDELGLVSVGLRQISTPNGQSLCDVYLVNIFLPNQVLIPNHEVIGTNIIGFDMLVGMDIIGLGDFCVSNFNKRTVFTFRIPSLQEYDFATDRHLTPYKVSKNEPPRNAPCPCGSGKKYKHCCGTNK